MVEISESQRRMGDAKSSVSAYNKVWHAGDERRKQDALVLSQLGGKRPFSDAALREAGQAWRTNLNFRDASSSLDQVLVGYWRLLHDTQNIAHFRVNDKSPQAADIEKILQKNFNRFYDDWGVDYVTQYLRLAFNHIAFGVGPLVYRDADSPRYYSLRRGDLVVSKHTPANVEEFEVVWIRRATTLSDIWKKVREAEASEKAGWDIDVLRKVCIRAAKGPSHTTDASDWLDVERELRMHALATSEEIGTIDEVHQYVREWDGKISHYVFYPKFMAFTEGSESVENRFAFDDFGIEKRPESFSDVLACVFFEVGFDGYLHEVKGFGVKNYDLATAQNRVKSRFIDLTLVDGGLNFRHTAEGQKPNLDIVNIGPFNIVPAGFEQLQYYPAGRTLGEVIAMLDGQTSHNNARYRDQSRQIQNTDTATQANILMNLQTQVDVSNSTLYLTQFGHIFQTQFERLRRKSADPDAKKFRERCEADGVPLEILDQVDVKVMTGANPGAASQAVRAQVSQQLLSMIGVPGVNPRYPLETYITSTLGANEVEKALVPEQAATQSDAQLRGAMMENTDMGDGNELPVDQHDLHHIHIPVHLQPIEVALQTYGETQQVDPAQLLAVQTVMPHLAAHFEYLKMDAFRKNDYAQLWPRFQAALSAADQLMARLEDMQSQFEATGQFPGQANQIAPNATPNPAMAPGTVPAVR